MDFLGQLSSLGLHFVDLFISFPAGPEGAWDDGTECSVFLKDSGILFDGDGADEGGACEAVATGMGGIFRGTSGIPLLRFSLPTEETLL